MNDFASFILAGKRSGFRHYLLAVVLVGLALWLRLAIAPVSAGLQYITFFPAVALAAIVGGYRPALLATAIGVALATFIFTPPYYTISLEVLHISFWSNIVFLTDGLIVSVSIEIMHRYRQRYAQELAQSRIAHAALEGSTRHLKRILDNMLAYVALLDGDGAIQEVNKAMLEPAACRREDVVGLCFDKAPWWSYDEEARARLSSEIEAASRGETRRYETKMKMGDTIVPIDFLISPVRDEQGSVVGLLATGVDISAREASEAISRRHKLVIDTARDGFWVADLNGNLLEANQAYADMSGYSMDELLHMRISQLESKEDPEEVAAHIADIIVQGSDLFESRHRHKDGHEFEVEVSVNHMAGTRLLFAFFRDITERKKVEEALRIAAATFETNEAIMITDANAKIIRVNRAFEKITGYRAEEAIGKNPNILKSGRHDRDFYGAMWRGLIKEGTWSGEVWDRNKSGNIYPKQSTISAVKNAKGETTQYISIFSDISERKKTEEEVYNLAFYDALTGLPNRRLLLDRLRLALAVAERSRQYGVLLFLDLDKFKTLNDTLGHEYGDLLLIEVAKRLKFCVRSQDIVARLGGDEFVVLIENVSRDSADASQNTALVAEKIRSVLAAPYRLRDNTHHSSPSIGVCLFHDNSEPVDELIKRADMAMYQAKDAGRNRVRFFDPSMQQLVETRAALESDLRQAISDRQFRLYYQIQMDHLRRPIGAEALIRWQHPTRGMVSPVEFIPVAEESSLILDIGHWVLDTGCRQIADWRHDERTRDLVLAINISAQQFKQPDFVEQVTAMIRKYAIDPSRLKLELTESVALGDINPVIAKMLALRKEVGVTLSLDDFGTGYSSLSYLKRLPLDQIKIDQSFVRGSTTDPSSAVMVKTIIDMAQNFGFNVIAEGVETEVQLAFLKENGCLTYQGYLFSKPVPPEAFEALVKQG